MACNLSKPINIVGKPGRPREYDRMKIVNDFIEYAKTHPDCLTVPCFASTVGITSGMMNNWANEDEENFRVAFNIGKELIGINRLNATNQKLMERSLYSQVIGNFDMDINIYQRAEKEFESKLKFVENSVSTDIQDSKLDTFINMVSKLQTSSKDLKSASINIITEDKS